MPRLYLEHFREGVARTFGYELLDLSRDSQGAATRDLHFGLVRSDYSDKPAYTALKRLIATIADDKRPVSVKPLSFGLDGDTKWLRTLLLQRADGVYFLAVWPEVSVWDTDAKKDLFPPARALTLKLARTAAQVRVHDVLRAKPLVKTATKVRSVGLSVPASPVLVEIRP
jgi:hypothetical protein